MGGIAGAGGLVGTGAFSSVSAQRDVNISVADDASALLALEAADGPNGAYATGPSQADTDQLKLDFTSTDSGGGGVGLDSVYQFDNVFTVKNQGTQSVNVWLTVAGSTFSSEDFYVYLGGDETTPVRSEDSGVEISPGNSETLGVYIDTHDLSELGEVNLDMTVNAVATTGGASVTCPVYDDEEAVLVSNASECGDHSTVQAGVEAVEGTSIDTVLIHNYGTYEGCSIEGDHTSLTLKSARSGKAVVEDTIQVSSAITDLNLTVENVEIDTPAEKDGLQINANSGGKRELGEIQLRDCDIVGSDRGVAFRGKYGTDYTLDALRLIDTNIETTSGYAVVNNTADITVDTLEISGCDILHSGNGVRLDATNLYNVQEDHSVTGDLIVTDSLFEDISSINASNANPALELDVGSGLDQSDPNIKNSTFRNNAGGGIELKGEDKDVSIENVTVEENGGSLISGIILENTNNDVSIADSAITDNGGYGINVESGSPDGVTVTDCTFSGNGDGDSNVEL